MSDTIAAISTALSEGGIGIVRLSGERSLEILKKVFYKAPENIKPRHAYYGKVLDFENKKIIDEAIFIYMKAPHTYTCEDVVEIQAHGSIISLKLILRSVLSAGARMAEPGEFTKLAFLNGRLDLTQAEAVTDLIKAKTEIPLNIATKQLSGDLGDKIKKIREGLLDILAQMAVNIDFPDEDIEQVEYKNFIENLEIYSHKCFKMLETSDIGKIAKEGIKVAIVGRPNVGKSSLMNAVLGEGRVIVTDIPGTTRDTIEESANIGGIPIVLVDTAGIRETDDVIERIGIEKSQKEIERSDLVVLVLDGSSKITEDDIEIISHIKNKRVLAIINKEDLGTVISNKDINKYLPDCTVITTSLLNVEGAQKVIDRIEDMFCSGVVKAENTGIITNERQRDALRNAYERIISAKDLLKNGEAIEIAELEVHAAFDFLGEIIGETAGEEILDAVFSKFCLGK